MTEDHTLYPYQRDKDVVVIETLGKIKYQCLNEINMHAR